MYWNTQEDLSPSKFTETEFREFELILDMYGGTHEPDFWQYDYRDCLPQQQANAKIAIHNC